MPVPSTRRIVDHILQTGEHPTSLAGFIAARRDAGDSWQSIAAAIEDATNGLFAPHWSTVQRWENETEDVA